MDAQSFSPLQRPTNEIYTCLCVNLKIVCVPKTQRHTLKAPVKVFAKRTQILTVTKNAPKWTLTLSLEPITSIWASYIAQILKFLLAIPELLAGGRFSFDQQCCVSNQVITSCLARKRSQYYFIRTMASQVIRSPGGGS